MRERDRYPLYDTSSPSRRTAASYDSRTEPVYSADAWAKRLAEMDQAQAADVEQAIVDGAELQLDVHLYRKRGSQFLGIGFQNASGERLRIFEYPEIQ